MTDNQPVVPLLDKNLYIVRVLFVHHPKDSHYISAQFMESVPSHCKCEDLHSVLIKNSLMLNVRGDALVEFPDWNSALETAKSMSESIAQFIAKIGAEIKTSQYVELGVYGTEVVSPMISLGEKFDPENLSDDDKEAMSMLDGKYIAMYPLYLGDESDTAVTKELIAYAVVQPIVFEDDEIEEILIGNPSQDSFFVHPTSTLLH